MHIGTVSSKYQILIPKKIREQLSIKPGQTFIFLAKGDSLELVQEKNIQDMRGIMKGVNTHHIRDRADRNE